MKFRMKLRSCSVVCLVAAFAPLTLPSCITTQRVGSNFSNPIFATAAPADNNRLFVVERGGQIKILNLTSGLTSVFLDLRSLVRTSNEQGLLGMVFNPDYQRNGRFYVNYTAAADGATHVVEYQVSSADPNVADPASARLILRVPQPQATHNGGWMGYRFDNYLYIALGDGGGSNDDGQGHTLAVGNAQDIDNNLLGKILRINPHPTLDDFPADPDKNYVIPFENPFVGIPGDDEIWAYGLRHPWRCSFDRLSGDFWIADVGEQTREEINFAPASSVGGENYGWRLREGTIATPTPGVGGNRPPGNVDPLYDYQHGVGQFQGFAVIGGYVYRGPIAELRGKYFFGDYLNRKVWSLTRSGVAFTDLTDWTSQFQPDVGNINAISSFGEDGQGNLYIVDLDGEIFKVVQTNPFSQAASRVRQFAASLMVRRP